MLLNHLVYNFVQKQKPIILVYLLILGSSIPIKSITIPRFYSKLFDSIRKGVYSKSVRQIVLLIIGLWVTVVVLGFAKNKIESSLVPDYLSYIRRLMFDNTISFYSENYKDIPSGEYITRCMDLSRNLRDIALYICNYGIPFVIISVCICGYYTSVLPKIGGLTFVGILAISVITYIYSAKSIQCSAKREAYYLNMNEKLNDSLTNLINIYINNQDEQEIHKNQKIENRHTQLSIEQNHTTDTLILLLSIISICIMAGVLIVSYNELGKGKITPVVFTSIILVLSWYMSYLMEYSNTVPHILNKFGIVHNSEGFLEKLLGHSKVLSEESQMLTNGVEMNEIDFRYPSSEKKMYQNFNIKIQPMEKVAIIGRSGSGKSTLAKLIAGIYKPERGRIIIGNVDTQLVSTSYIRKYVNYINQKTGLFNDSIIQNMKYGNNATNEKIISLLEEYQLLEIFNKIEKGVYGRAGINGGNLSLGMQKVAMIVRGLLKPCRVMILDEPLAALDAKTREKVIKLIQGVGKDKTVIIITHDKEIIPYMQRVINLDEEKLKKNPGIRSFES